MGLIVLLAGGIGLAAARPAAAAAQPAPKPAIITVTGTDSARGVRLTATVADAHGTPIAQATVRFFELTTEFGPSGQLVPLGSAVTSKTGVARLTYQPAVTGAQRFVASYPGGPAAGQASASVGVLVTSAHSPYSPAPGKPFAAIGRALDGVLVTAVLLILITLAVQVERVRRVCRAGR
jgi:hypothetical protein